MLASERHIESDKWSRGRTGEQVAALFLTGHGYRVLATNQRTPLGELDIICRQRSEIVVVEVKARSGGQYGDALESVGPRKVRRLRVAAAWWLAEHELLPCPIRFDVVTVVLDDRGMPVSVRHLANVFCG